MSSKPGSGELSVYATVAEAQAACADFLLSSLADALSASTGRVAFAVSGGSTPRPTYELMSASRAIDWERVDVFFVDDRCVAPEDKDSNYKLVMDSLGAKVPVRVVRMEGERKDREAAAAAYAKALPRRIDVMLLGMGPDGHTASLFPGHASLASHARVLFEAASPKPPPERLSLGPHVIREAGIVVMLVTGKDKAAMVAKARAAGSIDEVPARLARDGTWFIDEAAGGGSSES
ncbi:MAG: 6-phosphogluconolactonase [Clostridia bacterium]|nr:6-phosphogluconolactonase [Deltaproteobacteria bacterium]